MTTVAILDYGLGNLRSVMRGLERAGARTIVTSDLDVITSADGIVLPGVGAFSEGMEQLGEMKRTLLEYVSDSPVLGICLGMQMLMEVSEENGVHTGLGLVPGTVKKFPHSPGYKVPHMGWNTIHIERGGSGGGSASAGTGCGGSDESNHNKNQNPLFSGIPQDTYVYFVHSYYADTTPEYTLTSTDYINSFASSIQNKNAYGVQFHPEKSGDVGLRILKNFIGLL